MRKILDGTEEDVRAFLVVTNGTFNGLTMPETGNFDIGHMMQSLVKNGASFKLKGERDNPNRPIFLKLPLDDEDMLENKYSIDDLVIGKVGIVGIYKGSTKAGAVRSTLDYFQDQNARVEDGFIEETPTHVEVATEEEGVYLDVLAIIQALAICDGESE